MTSQNPAWELSRERGRVAAAAELEELKLHRDPGRGAALLVAMTGEPVIGGSHRGNKSRHQHIRLKADKREQEWADIADWSTATCSQEMFQVFYPNLVPDYYIPSTGRLVTWEDSQAVSAERDWRWNGRSHHLSERPHQGETVQEFKDRGGVIRQIPVDMAYKHKAYSLIGRGNVLPPTLSGV